MISAKEAAKKALDYFFEMNELVGLTRDKVINLAIEEIEVEELGAELTPIWSVTIGYEMPSIIKQLVDNTVAARLYKQIQVATDGDVISMRIRSLANE
jgi:hypothetical protein